jgi:hypothetical protein
LINTGYLPFPVKLKRGTLNWLTQKFHQGLRYYMAQGLPEWDASETNYVVGSFVSYGGVGFRCKTASPAGTNPTVDTTHWELMVLPQAGSLIRTSWLTSGTTLAKATGCGYARVWFCGGGGGGGGAAGDGNIGEGIAGGGATGSWGMFETATIPATWGYTLGAAGIAGNATPGDGGAGGPTTFTDGATTWTAPGGGGGTRVNLVSSSPAPAGTGGVPGAAASVTAGPGALKLALPGVYGQQGWFRAYATSYGDLGGGASLLPYGVGGRPRSRPVTTAVGTAASGYGSGGSGGSIADVTADSRAGAAGSPGLIILEEYV